jgi:hypothetical protein
MRKYDIELLHKIVERDNIIIDFENLGKVSSTVRINFICKCGTISNKTFRLMEKNGSLCKNCMLVIQSDKSKITCLERYGSEFAIQTEKVKEKMRNTFNNFDKETIESIKQKKKETCLKKYGTEFPIQNKEIQEKTQETSLKRYGVKRASMLPEYVEMAEQTCLKRYGVKYARQLKEIKEKIKKTCLERYGGKFTKLFKEKREQTCLKRYGVKYYSQFSLQNSYKHKIYKYPCGKETKTQGYEHLALDILVKEGFTYDDILNNRKDVPEIWYDFEGKQCRYFVDICIPKLNKMIEVKSLWTFSLNKNKLIAKAERCKELGYIYEFWVFDNKLKLNVF